nr:hypothetical protein [Tanacetum cinerariifolium]
MNQNFYNSNSSCFDQSQPQQFPVIHPLPKKQVLLLAWDTVFKIKDALRNKQYKPDDTQELFRKLFNDVQNIHEELAEYINTPGWNRPAFYNSGDDDDEDYTIAITSDFLITDSLSMGDAHLETIPENESDEFIKSSVEDLAQTQVSSRMNVSVVTPPKWVASEYGVRGVLLHRSTSTRYIRTTLSEFIQTDTLD